MKIALIAPGGFDRTGRERVIPLFLACVERLARAHEVHVFTLYQYPHPDRFPLAGATVHNVGLPPPGPLRAARIVPRALQRLRREHRIRPFDLFHGLWAEASGLVAALAGKRFRAPSVVSLAGGELAALPAIGYGGQLRLRSRLAVACALRLATAVTCASEYAVRPLRLRRPDARLLVFGADTRLFSPPDTPPGGPPWRLLHVASLNRVKDQPTLLSAFRQIHAEEPKTHLEIIGEDTLHGAMQARTRELGLRDAVTFHGFQPSDFVAARLRQSHLLLHSSLSEAGEAVYLEAALCGVPAVGTAVGHIADRAPEAAVAVPVGDDGALARAVLSLLRDADCRRAMGQRACEWARQHDADHTAAQLTALYHSLAEGRR